jgi:hypothetical protein
MEIRREIADNVVADQHCDLREVTIQAMSDRSKARVQCSKKGLCRRLLDHEEFEVKNIKTLEGRSRGQCTVSEAYEILDNPDIDIVGVDGWIPVGTLKIQESARKSESLTDIGPQR